MVYDIIGMYKQCLYKKRLKLNKEGDKVKNCCTYADFLECLIYSIDNVDWGNERSEKMTKLLASLDGEYGPCPKEVIEYQKRVDAEISRFEEGKICEYDLVDILRNIKKEVI